MAATSRKPAAAGTRPSRGHVQLTLAHHRDEHVERLLGDPVDLLHVEQRAVAHGGDQRPVDEHVGVVPLGEHPGRVEVPTSRAGVSSALPSTNSKPRPNSWATARSSVLLPVPGGPSSKHVPTGGERCQIELELAAAPHDLRVQALEQDAVDHRVLRVSRRR
jgi:hypothetical protein